MAKRTCGLSGCDRKHFGSGLCEMHYARRRRGSPLTLRRDLSIAEALAQGLDTSGGLDACWEWQWARHTHGYGLFRNAYVHRLMLGAVLGRDLEADEHGLHRCDNPPCANPAHLFVGTHRDNMRDMARKGRVHNRIEVDAESIRWLYERHVSPDRIADLFGVSGIVIRRRIGELGLPRRAAGRPPAWKLATADRAMAQFVNQAHAFPQWAYSVGLLVHRHRTGEEGAA